MIKTIFFFNAEEICMLRLRLHMVNANIDMINIKGTYGHNPMNSG